MSEEQSALRDETPLSEAQKQDKRPDQVIHEPVPDLDSRAEWHRKHHAMKFSAHEERHRAKRAEEIERRERKKKEKSERRARKQAQSDIRKRERDERRSRESKTREPRKASLGTRFKGRLPSDLQDLTDEMMDHIRKILPKSGASKSRSNSKVADPVHVPPAQALSQEPQAVQAVDPSNGVEITANLETKVTTELQIDAQQVIFLSPLLLSQRRRSKTDGTGNNPEKSDEHAGQSSLLDGKFECGHTKSVSEEKSASSDRRGEAPNGQRKSLPAAPGTLKRSSCLCGALPPNPSEYAADDESAALTPRIDTPGHQDPFSDPWAGR
ncbi:hypothetical protein LQW54_006176 [Pestalotiopsis sp. IQ-011]